MSKDPFDFIKKGAKSVANFLRPDDDRTTEEKLEAFLEGQQSGFAVPSSKRRRVNLSARSTTAQLTKAQQSKALGFDLPEVRSATQRVLQSQNPVVADAIRRAAGRPAAGPRIKLDTAAQAIPSPTPRPRPTPVKTKMA